MYKLVATFGPYLVAFLAIGGGMLLIGYLVLGLRLRPYVLTLCLFLLYVPLSKELRIGLGGGLNPTTLFVGLLAIMWLMQSRDPKIRTPIKPLLILWISINLVSWLTTSLGHSGLDLAENVRLIKRVIDPILLFFFTLQIREKREFRGLIVTICAGVLIVGFHAYVQGIAESGRIRGLLDHPNATMAFLSAYAPLLLAMALSVKSNVGRIAILLSLFVVLAGLFETGSRMGLLATAVAFLALFMISGNRLVVVAGIGAAIILVLAPQLMPERIYKRFEGMLDDEFQTGSAIHFDETNPDAHVGSRVAIWRGGLEIIRREPLTGTGFESFNDEIAPYLVDFYGEERERSAHNAYIKTAAELGIPALVILILIFLSGLKQSRFVFLADPDPHIRWLARGVFGTTLALIVSNLTTASYQDTENMAYFYVLTGIVAVLRTQNKQGSYTEAAKR
jgi:O-antigen ligase